MADHLSPIIAQGFPLLPSSASFVDRLAVGGDLFRRQTLKFVPEGDILHTDAMPGDTRLAAASADGDLNLVVNELGQS